MRSDYRTFWFLLPSLSLWKEFNYSIIFHNQFLIIFLCQCIYLAAGKWVTLEFPSACIVFFFFFYYFTARNIWHYTFCRRLFDGKQWVVEWARWRGNVGPSVIVFQVPCALCGHHATWHYYLMSRTDSLTERVTKNELSSVLKILRRARHTNCASLLFSVCCLMRASRAGTCSKVYRKHFIPGNTCFENNQLYEI